MVERHFATYDNWMKDRYRSTGGTRLREAPGYDPTRDYFGDSGSNNYDYSPAPRNRWQDSYGNVAYYDSADWYRPRSNTQGNTGRGEVGRFYTHDAPYPGYDSNPKQQRPHIQWYEKDSPPGMAPDSGPKPDTGPRPDQRLQSPFSCEQLMEDPNSELETTTTDLGNASRCFGQMTFKVFNGRVVPGLILHGIVYFDVTEPVRINKITLTGQSMVKKEISGRKGSTSEYPTNSFKKDIVTSSGGYQKRQPNQYQALTDTWDGTDLMEMLQLPEDFHEGDFEEWPFAGPIPLPPGTHAIPFSIRVAPEVNPTVTYKRRSGNRRKAVISHTTNVAVDVAAQSDKGGPMMNLYSDKIPVEIISCGGLPPVVNGSYVPANVQLVKLSYKDSSALIVLERKHFLPGDKVRIIIFTNNKRCLRNAYAELIKSTNLPELELSDNNDVIQAKKAPGIELLDRSKKASPDSRFNKTFISKVGDSYPPEDTNSAPNGRLNRNMDDKSLMPESQRQAGCTLELKVPKDAEPSVEVGDNRIRYHVRTHLNVRDQRKTESQAQLITVGEQLRHNYTLKYIKFIK